jgi:Tfp pilus assembly protein PilX
MPTKNNKLNKGQGGYALITALIFFLVATTAVIAGLSDSVMREIRTIRTESASKQSYFASESALEDAIYRSAKGKQIGTLETLSVASSTASVTISTLADGTKDIVSSADATTTERNTEALVNVSIGASFSYALQSGPGGIDLTSNIVGDAYTTGSIRGCGSCTISGAAIAAGRSSSSLDTDNSQPLPPSQSITFGNANPTQDVAQSFTVSSPHSITDLQVDIKKTGAPANATVRIMNDENGRPGETTLSTGTLSSTYVKLSYSWQVIEFDSNPMLAAGKTYWIVIDADTNPSGYYIIAANTGFPGGQADIGNLGAGTWFETSPAGLNSYFKLSIGANQSGISGQDQFNRLTVGTGYSYTMKYVASNGVLYCQDGTQNSKDCDTSRADPALIDYPITNPMIDAWKTEAASGGTISDNKSVGSTGDTVGPKKIVGDLNVSGGGTLFLSGTVWVTGDVNIQGGATIAPVDSTHSFVLVSDGVINIGGGAHVTDTPGNHIMFISTSAGDPAITMSGGSTGSILFAGNGGVSIQGGATAKSVVANHISISGGSLVVYDPDASQMNFTGSASGSMGIKSWKEVQ